MMNTNHSFINLIRNVCFDKNLYLIIKVLNIGIINTVSKEFIRYVLQRHVHLYILYVISVVNIDIVNIPGNSGYRNVKVNHTLNTRIPILKIG